MQTEKSQEIIFKICKTCNESKELNKYRPRCLECKKCNNKKDAANRLRRTNKFYHKNKEQMQEENLLNYYKRKYDNKNLSMFEVNLFRISV